MINYEVCLTSDVTLLPTNMFLDLCGTAKASALGNLIVFSYHILGHVVPMLFYHLLCSNLFSSNLSNISCGLVESEFTALCWIFAVFFSSKLDQCFFQQKNISEPLLSVFLKNIFQKCLLIFEIWIKFPSVSPHCQTYMLFFHFYRAFRQYRTFFEQWFLKK